MISNIDWVSVSFSVKSSQSIQIIKRFKLKNSGRLLVYFKTTSYLISKLRKFAFVFVYELSLTLVHGCNLKFQVFSLMGRGNNK